jgi:glycosyltransferase 2 family protein
MPSNGKKTLSQNRLVTLITILVTLIGVIVIVSDWQDIRSVLDQAEWSYLPIALLFTFFSYFCYSYGYAFVCELIGIQMRKRELAEACFISVVVNHVVTTGSVLGYSIRYLLMKMYNVSFKDFITSSFLHYYLTSLDMLIFLPLTFIYLLTHTSVPKGVAIALGLMTLFFTLVLILTSILIFFPSKRQPIIRILARIIWKILHRDTLTWLTQLDETFTRGTLAVRQHPKHLVWIMLLTMIDFICSIAAMGIVLRAFGASVSPPILVTGYVIGIMAGLVSMVPGGFGIQEGSMAGIYSLLGVQFEQAVLAAILFRILYYLVPYLLILLFYSQLLRTAKQQAAIEP